MLIARLFMRFTTQFSIMVVCGLRALANLAIRHPWRTLLVAGAMMLAVAPGLRRLKLRTDGHALVAAEAPEVRADRAIRDRFGIEDNLVVLIHTEQSDGIFNPGTLQLVRELTTELKALPGVNPTNILSLATEPSFRVRPGSLIHQKLLEPPLTTPAELAQLRDDLRQIGLYTGTLVSSDGRSTCVLVGVPAGPDRTDLYERVLAVVARHRTAPEDISVTGAPVAEALLGIHILEDLGVPKAVLGTSTRSHLEQAGWHWPGSFYELRQLLARNIGLVPVAVFVMIVVFWITFRTAAATILPLPEVAATLIFVFGLMGWCGVPIYLTIAVMPVLLTAMCVTDEIHVFSRYFALLREQPGRPHVELVRLTIEEMAGPVANTTLTTAIGFLSFACSPLKPVQAFGIFTAVGILFSLIYSLTVIPAMLTLIPPPWLVRRRAGVLAGPGRLATGMVRWALAIRRNRWWAMGAVAGLLALMPLGLRRLAVQDSWIEGFDPASEFRRATELVNRQFYGMHLLLVTCERQEWMRGKVEITDRRRDGLILRRGLVEHPALLAGSPIIVSAPGAAAARRDGTNSPPGILHSRIEMVFELGTNVVTRIPNWNSAGPFWEEFDRVGQAEFEVVVHSQVRPEVVRALAALAAYLRQRGDCGVGGVLGPYEYLETTRFMSRPHDPMARQLPENIGDLKLMWDYYGLALGQSRLRQIVDSNYWQSVTTVFLKNANFQDTARLLTGLRAYAAEKLSPLELRLEFAGDVAVSQSLIRGIVSTQVQSLAWSLVGIYLVTALLGRSLRIGLVCVLPSALAVAVNFAVMGWWGIPLGVATSMFAGMTLGIGVDFAIHLVEAYAAAKAGGADEEQALCRAMTLTGPPVVINTAAITLGFGVMLLSQVPANARLGLLLVLGLVNCLLASLVLLPLMLRTGADRIVKSQ